MSAPAPTTAPPHPTGRATATRRPGFDPAPRPGFSAADFTRIAEGGFGDGHNSYAHSAAWFEGRLYVGTTRSNLCMLRLQSAFSEMPLQVWPVECPTTVDGLYERLDRRSQIWCFDPGTNTWEEVFRAPFITGRLGTEVAREQGYRAMVVFQGEDDHKPALYVSAWGTGRGLGGLILKSYDGRHFEQASRYGILPQPVQATRTLTPFKGRMFMSPTARRGTVGDQANTAGLPLVYESRGPLTEWTEVSEPGFGDPGNAGIFSMAATEDRLYAGTFNLSGFQIWASDCEGAPPYRWHKLLDGGAGRGPLNQLVACMRSFNGAVYLGTCIQGGGHDRVNDVGPAAAEVIRLNADDSWDLLVGDPRETADGPRAPLSLLRAGFGNFFAGYLWSMEVHDGWLYAGTYDWSVNLIWAKPETMAPKVRQLVDGVGLDRIVERQAGFDLWRTADGENWLPVTKDGFGNRYNWGVRNIVSSPAGLFVGTANVFGPTVAVKGADGAWHYEPNPRGGLEVWRARA